LLQSFVILNSLRASHSQSNNSSLPTVIEFNQRQEIHVKLESSEASLRFVPEDCTVSSEQENTSGLKVILLG